MRSNEGKENSQSCDDCGTSTETLTPPAFSWSGAVQELTIIYKMVCRDQLDDDNAKGTLVLA